MRDGSVDLIYLNPPFNSNAGGNVLFKAPTGEHPQAQIEAFVGSTASADCLSWISLGIARADHNVSAMPEQPT